jgi:hypothetical protein
VSGKGARAITVVVPLLLPPCGLVLHPEAPGHCDELNILSTITKSCRQECPRRTSHEKGLCADFLSVYLYSKGHASGTRVSAPLEVSAIRDLRHGPSRRLIPSVCHN